MRLIKLSQLIADTYEVISNNCDTKYSNRLREVFSMDISYELDSKGAAKIIAELFIENKDETEKKAYVWFIPLIQAVEGEKINQKFSNHAVYIDNAPANPSDSTIHDLQEEDTQYDAKIITVMIPPGLHLLRVEQIIENFAFHRRLMKFIKISNRLHMPWCFIVKSVTTNMRITMKFPEDAIIKVPSRKDYFATGIRLSNPIKFGNSILFSPSSITSSGNLSSKLYGVTSYLPFNKLKFALLIVLFALLTNVTATHIQIPTLIFGIPVFILLALISLFLVFYFYRYLR